MASVFMAAEIRRFFGSGGALLDFQIGSARRACEHHCHRYEGKRPSY
jgi:hypothetical protein